MIGALVDLRVESSNDVVQYRLGDDKGCAAIAAIGWVAHAINRALAEKDCLVSIGRNLPPFKLLRKRAVPHQHYAVIVRLLVSGLLAGRVPADIIPHLDQRTVIQRPESD